MQRQRFRFKDQGCGRVWRVTGDYGSGKSSFALFLSRVASGGDLHHRFHRFYKGLPFIREKKRLLPVLVEGRRAAISEILILSIQASLKAVAPRITRGAIGKEIQDLIEVCQDGRRSQNADQMLLALVPKLASVLKKDGEFEGIMFVIDEMGKPLEFAAQHPDRGDIFVLQQLGELAARSGSTPVVVIGLLHQGFESYVGRQGIATQREWDKVAGRFDQIIFDHPADQVAGLVAMSPPNWKNYQGPPVVANWNTIPFKKAAAQQISPTDHGVYSFVIDPRVLAHPKNCFVAYVGKADRLTIGRRFESYFREKATVKRPAITVLLNRYAKYLEFCFLPIPI